MATTLDQAMVQEMKKELPSILAALKEKKPVETEKILEAILVTVISNDQTLFKAESRICELETEVKNLNEKIKQLKVETFRAIVKNISTTESDKSGNEKNGETAMDQNAAGNGKEKKKKFKPRPKLRRPQAKKPKTDEANEETTSTDQVMEEKPLEDGEERKESEKVRIMPFIFSSMLSKFEFLQKFERSNY